MKTKEQRIREIEAIENNCRIWYAEGLNDGRAEREKEILNIIEDVIIYYSKCEDRSGIEVLKYITLKIKEKK